MFLTKLSESSFNQDIPRCIYKTHEIVIGQTMETPTFPAIAKNCLLFKLL